MDYVIFGLIALVVAIILFTVLNYVIKRTRAPQSAQQGIWNAVYFIQLKQYQKALELLDATEAEYAMTPEMMCDFCIQKAEALKGLGRQSEAADAYDILYEALNECEASIKRNDALLEELKACYSACGRQADFEKWEQLFAALPEKGSLLFRKAAEADIDRIAEIYDRTHDEEEAGNTTTGWQRSIYPTRKTAEEALAAGELFVAEEKGTVLAAARINQQQVDVYANAAWRHDAPPEQVMVLHTLVVDPQSKGKGIGKKFVAFYEQYAAENGCPYLRMDTNERNTAARSLYRQLGYTEAGIVPCTFNGLPDVNLVCLEKKI